MTTSRYTPEAVTRPVATRDRRSAEANFWSGTDPRTTYEWESEERVQDAVFVLIFAALGCLAGWGLWVGLQRVLDWWLL